MAITPVTPWRSTTGTQLTPAETMASRAESSLASGETVGYETSAAAPAVTPSCRPSMSVVITPTNRSPSITGARVPRSLRTTSSAVRRGHAAPTTTRGGRMTSRTGVEPSRGSPKRARWAGASARLRNWLS